MISSSLRIATLRAPIYRSTLNQSRYLSTQGVGAVEKLRSVLDEYRRAHYAQCLPSRFKKDILKVAAGNTGNQFIASEGLQRVLNNIGASNRLSTQELDTIITELGGIEKSVKVEKMMSIL